MTLTRRGTNTSAGKPILLQYQQRLGCPAEGPEHLPWRWVRRLPSGLSLASLLLLTTDPAAPSLSYWSWCPITHPHRPPTHTHFMGPSGSPGDISSIFSLLFVLTLIAYLIFSLTFIFTFIFLFPYKILSLPSYLRISCFSFSEILRLIENRFTAKGLPLH